MKLHGESRLTARIVLYRLYTWLARARLSLTNSVSNRALSGAESRRSLLISPYPPPLTSTCLSEQQADVSRDRSLVQFLILQPGWYKCWYAMEIADTTDLSVKI